jgi:NADPH:quinone reductase
MVQTTAWHWIARASGGLDALDFVKYEVLPPGPGEVTIEVRASGVNPADWKHVARGGFDGTKPVGYEVSGVIAALGPDTTIGSGGGAPGDEVVAFRVRGGYASALTVPAVDVFAKPPTLEHPAAANLLLVGATAADLLRASAVGAGDTVVVHAASGAVGVSLLQQARLLGVHVVGTASERNFDVVRQFGGVPVMYGDGLEGRLREQAPDGYTAALDTIGTDEAVDVSLALVQDRSRIVTVAAPQRAAQDGFQALGGTLPASLAFRDAVRPRLVELAARGDLVVPVARTYPLAEARKALEFLQDGHPGGKLALIP